MRNTLKDSIKIATSFQEVLKITLETVAEIKRHDSHKRIGYVAGKVTADGKENIKRNLDRLHKFTEEISKDFGENIFSPADVFNEKVYWVINIPKPVHEQDFYVFWQKVLGSGITDIFMTPEWERSTGASNEHKTAKKLGLTIHYIK